MNALQVSLVTWEIATGNCTHPIGVGSNNLCRRVRNSSSTTTSNEDTSFTYNPEGNVVLQRQTISGGHLDTTYGYHTLSFGQGTTQVSDDAVAGSGTVTAGSRPAATATV